MLLRLAVATALLLAVPVASGSAEPPSAVAPSPGALTAGDPLFPGLGNGGYRIGRYDLRLRYAPRTRRLAGTVAIAATATQALSSFGLDLIGMTVSRVLVDGAPASFRRTARKLVVTPAAPIPGGRPFTVVVTYAGRPSLGNGGAGESGWVVGRTDGPVAAAFAEPDGARRWFPVNAAPTAKAPYDIAVTVPAGLTVVGNGRLVSHTSDAAAGTTTWHWRETAPMVSYAATVAIGRFFLQHSRLDDGTRILTAVQRGMRRGRGASARRGLRSLPRVLRFLRARFGPYPFSAAGGIVGAFGSGTALETQTRPLYDGAVDDELQAHELAHQWFGDSLTLTRWSDMWLHEGFATYAGFLWTYRRSLPSLFAGLWRDWDARSRPLAAPSTRTLFGTTTYVRGGTMLVGLQLLMGERPFFAMVREWTAAHRHGNVTTEEFVALARLRGGPGAESFLRRWLYGTRRPPLPAALVARLEAAHIHPRR